MRRLPICEDCGDTFFTGGNTKVCQVCRLERNKRPMYKICIGCGIIIHGKSNRCDICRKEYLRQYINIYMKQYRKDYVFNKTGCLNNTCFECPYDDCILPANNDKLPKDWYEGAINGVQ